MHKFAMEIMECVKSEVKSKGMNSLTDDELMRLNEWTAIADHIAAFDYHYHITEAMEKPENEYGKNYDENGKYYTTNHSGRYMRGYEHDPNMMRRDMDYNQGKMYYTESESRYDRAKRGYEESKKMNPSGDHISMMETLFDTLEEDIKELKPKMSASEKSIARGKLSDMVNMMM